MSQPTSRLEFYKSDRGERAYYESKRSLKERIKLPLTKDGCEALLEMVTEALELPLDDTMRQVFCGYIHHLDQLENSTSLGDVGKLLFNHMSKHSTWLLDQEAKESIAKRKEEEKAEGEKAAMNGKISLAKDPSLEQQEQDAVQ